MLTLLRFIKHPTIGVFGELLTPQGDHMCYTTETPWNNNMPYASCVPAALYKLNVLNGTVYLHNAAENIYGTDQPTTPPERWGCKVHKANWPHQLHGCIALGDKITLMNNNLGVTNSAKTCSRIIPILITSEWLNIKWA